jgi:spermidine/putrescine transport system permease protein
MFRKIKEQYFLMAPPLFWLLIFFIVPLFIVLTYSFCVSDTAGGVKAELTVVHYLKSMNGMYLYILLKSFLYAAITTLITLAISFPMAYYIAFASPRMRMVMMLMIILPFWTNFLVRMYSLMTLLGESGLINSLFINLGLITEPLPMMNNSFGMYVGFIYWNLPFMILPIASSLDRMDVSLLEASLDLGASKRQTFMNITLPYSLPGLVAGVIFTFIPTLGNFVIPEFLGGPGNIMIGNVITAQYLQARNWPFGSALSTVLMVVVMVFITVYIRFYDPAKNKNLVNF